jgi:hypothetical protein
MDNLNIRESLGYFSEDEISALTGHKTRTLANWRAKRIGPPFVRLPGKPPIYPRDEALAWLESRRVETSAA